MSTSISFPPSHRDFQIYQRVVVEAISTRRAASEFSLSQTRVRQLVQRVTQWLTENLPPQSEATTAAYLLHAQHVAADRLSFFYGEAMEGWRAERQMKYMNLAIRLALAQSKLPVIPGTLECLAADAIEGPLPDERIPSREQTCSRETESGLSLGASAEIDSASPHNASQENPSIRDCSPAPQKSPNSATNEPQQSTPLPSLTTSSAALPQSAAAARKAFLSPAHPLTHAGDEAPITELKITPEKLGFNTAKSLSRRQRRRLQRKLGA